MGGTGIVINQRVRLSSAGRFTVKSQGNAMTPTKEPSAVVERMSRCNKCGAEYPSAPPGYIHKCGRGYCNGVCSPIERGDHDTAEPGLCPRTLEAARVAIRARLRGLGDDYNVAFDNGVNAAFDAIRSLSPTTDSGGVSG